MGSKLKNLAGTTLVAASLALTLGASAQGQSLAGLHSMHAGSTGVLLGEIKNATGVAQMGATVSLFDRYGNEIRKAISTEEGRFGFGELPAGVYSIRVTLSSFFPALLRGIAVAAGTESLLQVNLATVLSTIDLVPGAPNKATLMSDEWKWVLRASQATRPVLRYLPDPTAPDHDRAFSDASGVVRVSAGDSNLWNSSMQQDMGTAFTVETAMSNGTKMRVSGSFGYGAQSGLPSAGFRTAYVREKRGGPAAITALTVRQAYFPASNGDNTPVLRTATFSSIDSINVLDDLRVDYGFALDSISLYGRMNYFSPFARATYDLGRGGRVQLGYSSGFAPTDLIARQAQTYAETADDLAALAQAPHISRRDNHAAVERGTNYEAAYEITDSGNRKYAIMAYREDVRNAVFLMSGDIGMAGSANLLADLNTRGTVFNAGNYLRTGASVSMTQVVNELLDVAIAGGRTGALIADEASLTQGELRNSIRTSPRNWVTVRVNAAVPVTGTRLAASYGWTDFRALMPIHQSLTGGMQQEIGWNVSCRQPLPSGRGVRMEVTAELRNLLAQGYLRMNSHGQTAVLTNAPRQMRGGLSFIF